MFSNFRSRSRSRHGVRRKFSGGRANWTICLGLSFTRRFTLSTPQTKPKVTATVANRLFPLKKFCTGQMFVLVCKNSLRLSWQSCKWKLCELLEYVSNLIKMLYEQSTHLIQIASCFFNVMECWKCAKWDFAAQMVCAVTHFRGNIGCKKCALLATMLLFHSCFFTHSINQASNTRLTGSIWPAKVFHASRNAFWEFSNN